MQQKMDWVKTIAIALAVLFFILWIINVGNNAQEVNVNSCNAEIIQLHNSCNAEIRQVFNSWQYAYNTLHNCYTNSMPSCDINVPILNESLE